MTGRGGRGAVVNGDKSHRAGREFDGGDAGTSRKGVCDVVLGRRLTNQMLDVAYYALHLKPSAILWRIIAPNTSFAVKLSSSFSAYLMRLNSSKSTTKRPVSAKQSKSGGAHQQAPRSCVRGSESAHLFEQVKEEAPSRLVELDFVVFVPLLLKSRLYTCIELFVSCVTPAYRIRVPGSLEDRV